MDTHVAALSISDHADQSLSARLPGEVDGPPDSALGMAARGAAVPEADERMPQSAPPHPRRRHRLLLGVSLLAVCVVGGFLVSAYNHVLPMPDLAARMRHIAASAGVQLPSVVAPAASLASVILPPSPPAIQPRFQPVPKDRQVQEVLSFRAGRHPPVGSGGQPKAAGAATPVPSAAARSGVGGMPVGYVPSEPGAAHPSPAPATPAAVAAGPAPTPATAGARAAAGPAPVRVAPTPDLTGAVVASLNSHPAPATTAPSSGPRTGPPSSLPAAPAKGGVAARGPAPTHAPSDPVDTARALRAAPMSSHDQVQVLGLVTQLATMLHDLRDQDAALRQDLEHNEADAAARLDDFNRRLSLSEARKALAAARASPDPMPAPVAAPVSTAAAPVRLTSVAAATGAADPATSVRHYRVQAASPGLALLAQVDRGGGDGAQLQVAVGDTIPGYGRVKSIAQRGTRWVVMTEHGAID